MSKDKQEQPVKFGYLYKMAWGFEILAAATGLTIALTQIDPGNNFLAVLPITLVFGLVALAELTKIPLITVALNANKKLWSAFFIFATMLLMIITFETTVTGLSNGAAYRLEPVTILDEQLQKKNLQKENRLERISVLEDSLVGGKISKSLAEQIEKEEARMATFNCETITQSRTWYTAFLLKKNNVHVNEVCAKEQEKVKARLDQATVSLSQIRANASTVQNDIDELTASVAVVDTEIEELRDQKADVARTNSIYAMAFSMKPMFDAIFSALGSEVDDRKLYSPADLDQYEVNKIVSLFFGTLALIVSCTGPFLAAAYVVLNHENGTLVRKVIYNAKGEVISDHQDRTLATFSGNDNNGHF